MHQKKKKIQLINIPTVALYPISWWWQPFKPYWCSSYVLLPNNQSGGNENDKPTVFKPVSQELVVMDATVWPIPSFDTDDLWSCVKCHLCVLCLLSASDGVSPGCTQDRGSFVPLQPAPSWNLRAASAWAGAAGETWVWTSLHGHSQFLQPVIYLFIYC